MTQAASTNNIIFNSNHYYMNLLVHAENIKKDIEYKILSEDAESQNQLREVMDMWYGAFCGLLRNGLEYEYIKDGTNSDLARLTIDSINYDCPVKILKKRLKKDNFKFLDEIEALQNNPVREERFIQQDKDTDEVNDAEDVPLKIFATEKEPVVQIEKDDENTHLDDVEYEVESDNQNDSLKQNSINQSDVDSTKSTIMVSQTDASMANAIETRVQNADNEKYVATFENSKNFDTYVYNEAEIEIFQPGALVGTKFYINIIPVRIKEKDVHPDIIVSIKDEEGKMEFFSSETNSAVITDFDGYQLLIRGAFENGKFMSYILPAKTTAAIRCNINKDILSHECNDRNKANYGHTCISKMGSIIHAFPLEKKEEGEKAKFIVCVETDNKYSVMANFGSDSLTLSLKEGILSVFTYWVDNDFIIETA